MFIIIRKRGTDQINAHYLIPKILVYELLLKGLFELFSISSLLHLLSINLEYYVENIK